MADALAPLVVLCPACRLPLGRKDADTVEQSAEGPRIEIYQCSQPGCGPAKLAVLFELSGDLAPADPGFVQREIARRGAFFPSDLGAGRHGPRNW